MSIGGVLLVAGAALGGYLIYDYWENQKAAGCPEGQKLTDLVARVADGSIDAVTAESMARGFDNAGCSAAASAVRVASHARTRISVDYVDSGSPSISVDYVGSAPSSTSSHPTGHDVGLPSSGGFYYALSTGDVLSGVTDFASRAGYPTPRLMIAAQPAANPRIVPADGTTGASVFTEVSPLDPSITYSYRVVPWAAGTKVWVLKDPGGGGVVSTSGYGSYRRVAVEEAV